jgi:hypothetical protein
MDRPEVDCILCEVEQKLAKGEQIDLKQLGFWRAVEEVKRYRELIEAYADRVSAIEREVFRHATWIDVPLHLGLIGLATGTLIGLVLVGGAFLTPSPVNGLMILRGPACCWCPPMIWRIGP